MPVSTDIAALSPHKYLWVYAAVNSGFLASAQARTNDEWKRIKRDKTASDYNTPLSASPNPQGPQTHSGCNGLVDRKEALSIADYYDSIDRADIDAAILDQNMQLLWSKENGVEPSLGPVLTYPDWLATNSPPLNIKEETP